MQSDPKPLYVRLAQDPSSRLERAVTQSGKTKRQLIEDAVRAHLNDDGLVVGRIAPLSDDRLVVGHVALRESDPEILTLAEAAALLRVEESELERAAAGGELPGRRIGASWRFSRASLLSWLGHGEAARE